MTPTRQLFLFVLATAVPILGGCDWLSYEQRTLTCGDGLITPGLGEECDGSTLPADRGCETFSYTGGTLGCTDQCRLDFSGCYRCGNGIKEGVSGDKNAEKCDGDDVGDRGLDLVRDKAGNLYITGVFSRTADFGAFTLTSRGGKDIFVAKLSDKGAFVWARRAGGVGDDEGVGVALSEQGDRLFVTGSFAAEADFGTLNPLVSRGETDVFVAALKNADGGFLWAASAGGDRKDTGRAITRDSSDNIYISSYFMGIVAFGSTTLTSVGDGLDVYVARVSSAAAPKDRFVWATRAGGPGTDIGRGLAWSTADDSLRLTGVFEASARFGASSHTSMGGTDIFVSKVSSKTGGFEWTKDGGGAFDDWSHNIVVDSAGASYIVGDFNGQYTMLGDTIISTSWKGILVAKLTRAGKLGWARSVGGTWFNHGHGIALDAKGNCYVTGTFEGTATYGDKELVARAKDLFVARLDEKGAVTFGSVTLTSRGKRDIFVARYLASSRALAWARRGGGAYDDMAFGVAADAKGNSYITGRFDDNSARVWASYAPAVFGKTTLVSRKKQSSYGDIFVASLDSGGAFRWVASAGSPGVDTGRAVAVDARGACLVTGSFYSGPVFGADPPISRGGTDIFLARYDASGAGARWGVAAGGPLNDQGRAVASGAGSAVHVGGAFVGKARFGLSKQLVAKAQDLFVFALEHAR